MASRKHPPRESPTQSRALPGGRIIRASNTSSEEGRQAFQERLAQKTESTNDVSKLTTSIGNLPAAQRITALATLPKREQDIILCHISDMLVTAASYGDSNAELIVTKHRDELNYLCSREREPERIIQETAESLTRAIAEYRTQCRSLVAEVLCTWEVLRMILRSYEALVQKRWLKETPTRRREILLKAWPNMPESHRPDIAKLFQDGRLPVENVLPEFAWPYINLEDLSEPKALLIFLNSRGRNHPTNFAYSDLELAPLYKIPKEYIDVYDKNTQ